jgi:imidazolonepropionase-like amidohydrolase
MGTVAFIRQTFYDAIHYRDEWNRYDKIKRGVSRPVHNKRLAALQATLKGELPVMFIATSDLDIGRALAIADEFKLKPIIAGAGAGAGHRTAELLKNRNIPVVLSVDFPRRQGEQADDEDEPLRVLRERAEAPKAGARLAEAGVKFGLMSGSLRAQDFISNVQRAVENGLSREAALRALTIDAAEILGVADQMGSIEVGKIANLVITTGDLFSRDSRVRHVFIDGVEIELRRPEPAGPARREVRPGDSN